MKRKELVDKLNSKLGCKLGSKYNTEWCAAFVSDELLIPLNLGQHWSCTEMRNYFQKTGRVNHDYKTAEIGDIILFDWDKSGDCDHVGIVIGNENGKITTIEGNVCGDNYLNTCVGLKSYPYDYGCFSCIIDMSDYFAGEVEQKEEDTKKTLEVYLDKKLIFKAEI